MVQSGKNGGGRMSVYEFSAKTITGDEISLQQFAGQVLLIVNTASRCGFTPQYKELQDLYERFHERGFTVLGFPCNQFGNQEPGSEEEISQFCSLSYGVTFPMFAKVDVNGANAHPLFTYLKEQAPGVLGTKTIKWNFTKFLIDRKGNVVGRYASNVSPLSLLDKIETLLTET